MKVIVELLGVTPAEVGDDVWERLSSTYPQGVQGSARSFSCRLSDSDATLVSLLGILNEAGCRPWHGFRRTEPGEYWLRKTRIYAPGDVDECRLLIPCPPVLCGAEAERQSNGRLAIPANRAKLRDGVAGGEDDWLMVSSTLRDAIETAELERFTFRDIEVLSRGKARLGEVHELTSEFRLPPLSPVCSLYDAEGNPFSGDFSNGCFYREDFFRPAELHYRSQDLTHLPPFDFALTHERFGNGDPVSLPFLVTSQRFRQFCRARGIKMDWIPVRIDD